MPLVCLNESVLGIDATYFLQRFLAPAEEPLLSALGGFPLSLEDIIARDLSNLQSAGIKIHFVFSGLEGVTKGDSFGSSIASARANAEAFETYENDLADEAIKIFRNSGTNSRQGLTFSTEIDFSRRPNSRRSL